LSTPSPFLAVGAHYAEFGQLADADVISLLEERQRRMARSGDRQADETGCFGFRPATRTEIPRSRRRRELAGLVRLKSIFLDRFSTTASIGSLK
jgi:hypothetical protein